MITQHDGASRLLCYCNLKGSGWWYEVTPGPRSYVALEVDGNSVLEAKYGFTESR